MHSCIEPPQPILVLRLIEKFKHWLPAMSAAKGTVQRVLRCCCFRVQKTFGEEGRGFEGLVGTWKADNECYDMQLTKCRGYQCPIRAASPKVLSCFEIGLRKVINKSQSATITWTYSCLIEATDFPVSRTKDKRLLENTSRETSWKI